MKNRIIQVLLAVAVLLSCGSVFAETPIKLSLLPNIGIPKDDTIRGLDIGLLGDSAADVQGVQVSWIYSEIKGNLVGVQFGLVNLCNNVTGVQWGFYNQAESVTGLQMGLVNVAKKMKGLQIGLVNIISSGSPLPFMVIVNGNF